MEIEFDKVRNSEEKPNWNDEMKNTIDQIKSSVKKPQK